MTTADFNSQDMPPPPEVQLSPINWLKKNLFSTWYNILITAVICLIFLKFASDFVIWARTQARWEVLIANYRLFYIGTYPVTQAWRIWIILGMVAALSGLSWGVIARGAARLFSRNVLIGIGIACAAFAISPATVISKIILFAFVALLLASAWGGQKLGKVFPQVGLGLSFAWFISYCIFIWLMGGGLGLRSVSTNSWEGLLLTVFMAITGIVLCFPFGIMLALGRQSSLPIIRWLSTAYIELVRGVPLITILFFGQVLLPLFLPPGVRPDRVLRAIVGLTMFSVAYLAENVRGGLQALPRGQTEAARALGLSTPLTLIFIILPQALKSVIPAIIGQFISLLQDTTLLAIVGLSELLGISNSILANPKFIGTYKEAYLFIGVIYWLFCFAMSVASKRLEATLNVDQR